ncbi:prolyl oligopeptidase family serine peptidase [Prosthecobacter sp.]|uniref:carboxylesterase family protein n=1 Tax=Prosthecobacter sp. TaxID=1965333 RepID=UPI002AB9F34A|nr:prolyl oligopeptidase family serine peptidase [Prosthecobacter sp.]MDZ4401418.1 prolyl oligopeptidase family serine peptidase [Prosthecobacter sp.]
MKTLLTISLCSVSLLAIAQDKGINPERLMSKDANKDGKLSKEELGDKFWQRAAGQDANGDGVLDPTEIAAMQGKKGRKGEDQTRPGGSNAAFQVREFKGTNGQTLRYSLFVPAQKTDAPLPLVLCLHGSGGNTAAANVLAAPEMQAKHPCIVIAPACDGKSTRWVEGGFRIKDKEVRAVMPELMEMLDAVMDEFKADPARIYLTGQSLGGVGSWGLIANHPGKFAAAVPVCGFWDPAEAAKMNGVAIWAFHGADDPTVPVSGSRDMIAALKKAAVTPEPKYTEFPGVGHGSWVQTYETAELWEWLFAQRKAKP